MKSMNYGHRRCGRSRFFSEFSRLSSFTREKSFVSTTCRVALRTRHHLATLTARGEKFLRDDHSFGNIDRFPALEMLTDQSLVLADCLLDHFIVEHGTRAQSLKKPKAFARRIASQDRRQNVKTATPRCCKERLAAEWARCPGEWPAGTPAASERRRPSPRPPASNATTAARRPRSR